MAYRCRWQQYRNIWDEHSVRATQFIRRRVYIWACEIMACAIMQQQLNLAEWVERKIFTSVRGRPKRPGYMQRAPVIASFSKHPLTMHTASRKNNAPSLFWTISRALLVLFFPKQSGTFYGSLYI